MLHNGEKGMCDSQCANVTADEGAVEGLDPVAMASDYMICDECNNYIPVDEHGFNYDHYCLDLHVIHATYVVLSNQAVLWRADGGTVHEIANADSFPMLHREINSGRQL